MRRSFHSLSSALVLSVVVVCAGCGTAEYETKLDGAVKQLTIDNKFRDLDRKETLIAAAGNTKVVFRKPTFFPELAFAEGAADPRAPAEALPIERVKPPVLADFPGFQFSYETVKYNPTVVASLYMGTQAADAAVLERIVADLQSALPDLETPPAWTTVRVDAPDGSTIACKMLTLTATQTFWIPGNDSPSQLLGTFVVWLRELPGRHVFVGLRTTAKGEPFEQLKKQMAAAVGTVRIVTE